MAKAAKLKPTVRAAAPVVGGATSSVTHTHTQVKAHSGPIPSPEVLGGYDAVLPGAAERILRMAEVQQESRLALERRQFESDAKHRDEMTEIQRKLHQGSFASDYLGQLLGFLIAAASLGLAAYAGIWKGNLAVAALFLGLPVVGMIQAIRGIGQRKQADKT